MKRISKIVILFVLIILLSMGSVYALGFNFSATPSETTVKQGDTVTINFGISNIDAGELGINTIEALLEYDKNIFEIVNSSSFEGLNNWSITYNGETGENEGKFVAVILQNGVTKNQDIGKLTLKVKENATDGQTQIVLKGIKTNDGTTEIPTVDQNIKINVKKPEPVVDEPNDDKPTDDKPTIEKPEKPTTSPDPIPQTGETTFIILGVSGVILLIAIITLISYRKIRDIK